ncbi:hypothetical protein [Ancylobacter sp.]|uniref:hypothetical protein n=1 Tax=Ancylobacter sp. TaxID=1872567 RepID=UPI003BA932EF
MSILPSGNGDGSSTGIWSTLKAGVAALNNLNQTVKSVFPQSGYVITPTATAGAATLPANPEGFVPLILADGTVVKVAVYNP